MFSNKKDALFPFTDLPLYSSEINLPQDIIGFL